MKKVFFLLMIGMFMMSCNQQMKKESLVEAEEIEITEATDGVFIHITEAYDDPHRVLMPMKMALMMSKEQDVLVYMDIDAVNLLVKDAKDLNYKDFDSFQTYLAKLIENGVGVYACPTCLTLAGFSTEDLMEGVQTANKDRFFDFTEGRILSVNY